MILSNLMRYPSFRFKLQVALTKDQIVTLPHTLLVVALCNQILTLIHNIRVYDKQIATLFKTMPDAELFD
jgi:hypothetical protein